MPVQVMLNNMTSMEITEWKAFYLLRNEIKPVDPTQQSTEDPKNPLDFMKQKFGHLVKKP